MEITQQNLKDWSACTDGYKWACGILNDKPMDVKEFLEITAKHRLDWASWVICRVFDKPNKVRYAIFAAEKALHLFEKRYPDDERPRLAIEAAKKCIGLKGVPSDAASDAARAASAAASAADWAARAASWAASAAAWAARAASWAASAAASDAAWAASDAASDAAWAARAAAWAASDAVRYMQIKILNYGLSLLDEQCKGAEKNERI